MLLLLLLLYQFNTHTQNNCNAPRWILKPVFRIFENFSSCRRPSSCRYDDDRMKEGDGEAEVVVVVGECGGS